MKKALFLSVMLLISITVFSQGFFRPVDKDMFKVKLGQTAPTSVWLVRPSVELTALQFNLTKPIEVISFSSLGTGISYQHFVEVDGLPYNNFGVNALVLFPRDDTGIELKNTAVGVTVNAFQYINVGAGYSFGIKKFCILTGVAIHFN